jgi:hypothetical protein
MSTKTQIQTRINTIETGVLNPAVTVRNVLGTETDSLLENFYGIKTTDNNATTNVFTEDNAVRVYGFAITKIGTRVFVEGTVRNAGGSVSLQNVLWFSITNTEYEQQTGFVRYITGHSQSTGEPIKFILTTNVFASLDSLGINEVVELNFSYNTNA